MLRKTIYGFLKNQNYDLDDMTFCLADNDSKGQANLPNFTQQIVSDFPFLNWQVSIEKTPGWGNNVNTAFKKINTNFIFLIEDDREAYDVINLRDGVKLLSAKKDVGLIRYDGIAGHSTTVLRICNLQAERFSYCTIDHKLSRRPITYSHQPHLRHVRFTKHYGYYPENVNLATCERQFALHVKRDPNGPKIAILEDGIQNRFRHLGAGTKSRQHTKWDKI
jgi:hypothetical protein